MQSVAATLCPPTAILKPKCVFWLYFRQILTGIFSSLFVCARLCKGMVCAGRSKSCKNKNQDAIGFMKVCARSAHIGPVSVEMKVWGQRNFVSLCLVCLASAFASERTSLILPIYQRYNLQLCCVISCPSV